MLEQVNICLIGGSGRSGTTILKKIFAQHPSVAFIPEWRFTIDPDGLVDFFNAFSIGWSPYQFDVKVKRLERLLKNIGRRNFFYSILARMFFYMGLSRRIPCKLLPKYVDVQAVNYCPEYFMLVDQLIENLVQFRYQGFWTGAEVFQSTLAYASPLGREHLASVLGNFFREVVRFTLEHQQARYYVEDNTWNILWFDRILQLVPEARLVHIYRDPRDVVASYTQQAWAPSNPSQAAHFYKDIMSRWWEMRAILPPHTFTEIALEALVASPRKVLTNLCNFWHIPWDDVLLEVDLSHAHSGRWRKDFDRAQQGIVSDILEEPLFKLGYI